jgi:hypothetical protein
MSDEVGVAVGLQLIAMLASPWPVGAAVVVVMTVGGTVVGVAVA